MGRNLLHSATTLSSTTPNEFLFAGEQFDPDLGLYYNRARYLNTSTGRFWSMDSHDGNAQHPSSLHKYFYASNNPVNRIDPSGRFDLIDIAAGSQIATGLNFSEGHFGFVLIHEAMAGGSLDLVKALGVYPAPDFPFGFGGISEGGVLRYTQTSAKPLFSTDPKARFPGESVSSLADKIKNKQVPVSDVPIRYVERNGNVLIINTRSSVALQKAGVPPEEWNWIQGEQYPNQLEERLARNGLDENGIDVVEITEEEEFPPEIEVSE